MGREETKLGILADWLVVPYRWFIKLKRWERSNAAVKANTSAVLRFLFTLSFLNLLQTEVKKPGTGGVSMRLTEDKLVLGKDEMLSSIEYFGRILSRGLPVFGVLLILMPNKLSSTESGRSELEVTSFASIIGNNGNAQNDVIHRGDGN